MNQIIESLKRLYDKKMIGRTKVIQLFDDGKLTKQERLCSCFFIYGLCL